MFTKLSSVLAISACLIGTAAAQQGVPYFPQTLPSGSVVGRTSAGPGPTEAISMANLLAALFPNGSAANPLGVSSLNFQGSLSGQVTMRAQAATATYSILLPNAVGANNSCLTEIVSGATVTLSPVACALLGSTNTFTSTNNFTGTFQKNGVAQTFPTSGLLVGTTDTQTLTNKSIDAGQITGTLPVATGGTGDTGTAWTTFTPSPACGTATITTNSGRWKTLGKTVFIEVDFTITVIGTCTNSLTFTLPFTPAASGGLVGREVITSNYAVGCGNVTTSTTMSCAAGSNSNFLVNSRMVATGVMERQ